MSEKTGTLKGMFIPGVTPFDPDGELLLDNLVFNIKRWSESPISGLMVLGTNGEARCLNDDESLQVVETAAETIDDKLTLIAGIGRESLSSTLKFLKRVSAIKGVDYFSVLTPSPFPKLMTDEALYAYYCKIADASPVPILIYTAPAYANQVMISPELLYKLSNHPNIAGIKDTSTNMMEHYMAVVGHRTDFTVMAGTINNLLRCLKLGGRCGLISAANYFPAESTAIIDAFFSGKLNEAEEIQNRLRQAISKTAGLCGVAGVKAVMELRGYRPGCPRNPILPVSPEVKEQMSVILKEANLL